jgi:hypothetical protein
MIELPVLFYAFLAYPLSCTAAAVGLYFTLNLLIKLCRLLAGAANWLDAHSARPSLPESPGGVYRTWADSPQPPQPSPPAQPEPAQPKKLKSWYKGGLWSSQQPEN